MTSLRPADAEGNHDRLVAVRPGAEYGGLCCYGPDLATPYNFWSGLFGRDQPALWLLGQISGQLIAYLRSHTLRPAR